MPGVGAGAEEEIRVVVMGVRKDAPLFVIFEVPSIRCDTPLHSTTDSWAPTVSVAIAAKRAKLLDTCMVVWMVLLVR